MATQSVLEQQGNVLCIMGKDGDTRLQWDSADPAQVAETKKKFDELKQKGYAAYSVNRRGDQGEVIQEFDPEAERIIMALPLVGG